MPWIKFERDWDWDVPKYRHAVTIAFKRGMTIFATREAAALALAKGRARELTEEEAENVRRSRA